MSWKILISLAIVWLAACELLEYFAVRRDPGDVYPPKILTRFFYWTIMAVAFYAAVGWVRAPSSDGNSHPLIIGAVCLGLVLVTRPRSLVAGPTGVSSCGIFGLFRRCISWTEVSNVSYDWEEHKPGLNPLWWLLESGLGGQSGSRITVAGRNGRRIRHTIFNVRQSDFLEDLKRYLPRDVFAPGTYDWCPK